MAKVVLSPRWQLAVALLPLGMLLGFARADQGSAATAEDYRSNPERMIEAYRHVEAASVSDAEEQSLHQTFYMSHSIQPIFPAKFAGPALTVLLKKQENHDPNALAGMLAAIDSGQPGSVYAMQVENGRISRAWAA